VCQSAIAAITDIVWVFRFGRFSLFVCGLEGKSAFYYFDFLKIKSIFRGDLKARSEKIEKV
jgi:hypothetical protein